MAKYVGQRIKRTEDPRLIQGLGHYVDDIKLPDTLHVAFLRSMYAHAKIKSIDTSEASHAPGVVAVYTGKDVAGEDRSGALRGRAAGVEDPGLSSAGDRSRRLSWASPSRPSSPPIDMPPRMRST